jgi:hypothetical protein
VAWRGDSARLLVAAVYRALAQESAAKQASFAANRAASITWAEWHQGWYLDHMSKHLENVLGPCPSTPARPPSTHQPDCPRSDCIVIARKAQEN